MGYCCLGAYNIARRRRNNLNSLITRLGMNKRDRVFFLKSGIKSKLEHTNYGNLLNILVARLGFGRGKGVERPDTGTTST
jgi:hypothetical protein